jgi:tripartite-type tricarboxylate transporter receptor subunit TctC
MPTFDVKTWNGVIAPAGVPKAIIDKLAFEIGQMMQKQDIRDKLDSVGVTSQYNDPEQFLAMIKSDQAMYLKVIKANNIRIE